MPYRFKLYVSDSIRRFQLEDDSLDSFFLELKKIGVTTQTHKIEYLDDEKEWVTLERERDWTEAQLVFKSFDFADCIRVRATKKIDSQRDNSDVNPFLQGEEFLQRLFKRSGTMVNDVTKFVQDSISSKQIPEEFKKYFDQLQSQIQKFQEADQKGRESPKHCKRDHCHARHGRRPQFFYHDFFPFGHAHSHENGQSFVPRHICDSCNKVIVAGRYRCMKCPDYDLCGNCMPKNPHRKHNVYTFFSSPEVSQDAGVVVRKPWKQYREKKSSKKADNKTQPQSAEEAKEVPVTTAEDDILELLIQEAVVDSKNDVPQEVAQPELASPVIDADAEIEELDNVYEPVEYVDVQVEEAVPERQPVPVEEIEVVTEEQEPEEDPFGGDLRLKESVELLESMGFSLQREDLIRMVKQNKYNLRKVVELLLEA